jgi:glucose/arabinose dehydrogenase
MSPHPVNRFAPFALVALIALGAASIPQARAQTSDAGKREQTMVPGTAPQGSKVAQNGRKADELRATLQRIKLPPGFRIALHAVVPDARSMAIAPSGDLLFVGTRMSSVWVVTRDGGANTLDVEKFAPSLRFRIPNAVCWTPAGALIVVELNRVLSFPSAASFGAGSDVAVRDVVPQGRLIPPEEEAPNHGARVCRVGPDGKLYIAIGQPFNVQPRDKLALYAKWGMGGIVRMNLDGSGREIYASGLRNSVGMDFNPRDKTLWFTDNQTDGMGDEIPKGEINRATKPGQFFGYPYIVSRTRITEFGYDKDTLPAGAVDPQVMTDAHAADLGMAFYTGTQFPAKYRNGFFSAQHGSWNRSKPIGARLLFTSLKEDGSAGRTEVFAEGWLDDATGNYRGQPVDVAMAKDGSLLVSDDRGGAIYRISYGAP